MWLVGARDLLWRRRRFFIAVIAAALVFALTLLLAGLAASFHNEVGRTVRALRADAWVVPRGIGGPFTSINPLNEMDVQRVASLPGVRQAAPLIMFRSAIDPTHPSDVNVIGYEPGPVGSPAVTAGRPVANDAETVVDDRLGKPIGATLRLSKARLRVVGTVHGMTYLGGTPVALVTIHAAQDLLFRGSPLVTTVVTRGKPRAIPPDLRVLSNADVRADLVRPVSAAANTIGFIDVLLWAVTAGIIGAVLYMSALERVRDFAVMKAIGAPTSFVLSGLAFQGLVLAFVAGLIAVALAYFMAPAFPVAVEIPGTAYLRLFIVAVIVAFAASAAGVRRAIRVDPALAFGGA